MRPVAVWPDAPERTVTGSPTRTASRWRAGTFSSAHTLDRSATVKALVLSCTASPSVRCFSTTTPSNGARSVMRPMWPAAPLSLAPSVCSFCCALRTLIWASRKAVRACCTSCSGEICSCHSCCSRAYVACARLARWRAAISSARRSDTARLDTSAMAWPLRTACPSVTCTASTTPAVRGTMCALRSSSKRISPGKLRRVCKLAGALCSSAMPAVLICASLRAMRSPSACASAALGLASPCALSSLCAVSVPCVCSS